MTARRTASKNAPLPRTAYHHGKVCPTYVCSKVQVATDRGAYARRGPGIDTATAAAHEG